MDILENNNKNLSLTVSQCAKTLKQPRGGYLKRIDFETKNFGGEYISNDNENISPVITGLVVDYLVRYKITKDKNLALAIPLLGVRSLDLTLHSPLGAILKNQFGGDFDPIKLSNELFNDLDLSFNDDSIIAACKLAAFEVAHRRSALDFTGIDDINPDKQTINQIKKLVNRSLKIFDEYGGIIDSGFSFQGAYTKQIINGDADYLSPNILWDMKNIKGYIDKSHTMQLLIYWRLGMKSNPEKFSNINFLGIINPRKDETYLYDLSNIDEQLVEFVDKEIIGYK